jgi:hypothetical protein
MVLPRVSRAIVRPGQGTIVLQLAHESGVHQEDEMCMAGLAMPVPELTIAHAQVLLPVSVKGLGSGPATLVDLQHAMGFPMGVFPLKIPVLSWRLERP